MKSLNKTKNHIKPVPRDLANLEAEKGETILTNLAEDGIPELFIVDGKRHANGGSPLNVPDNSFIYSDYVKMKIKDDVILDDFMITNKKKGYTPADISKKYTLNEHKQILSNPDSSDIERRTAELMIRNKMLKLGELALVQEAKKGLEDGVPMVAIPYINSLGITPEELVNGSENNQEQDTQEISRLGMQTGRRYLTRYQRGGLIKAQKGKQYSQQDVDNYEHFKKSREKIGSTRTSTEDLRDYGSKLIKLREFFINHPDELDKFYNTWKNSEIGKSGQYNISKDDFLDSYVNWLYTKQSWLNSGEGGHDENYWNEVSPYSASGKQRRNTKEYSNAFNNWANLDENYVKAFQSMDIAMNDYAKSESGKKYRFTTNDVWEEDSKSNAGYSSTTGQGKREGVSIADGLFGKRTADFLPFIDEEKEEKPGDKKDDKKGITPEHIQGTRMTYDYRWNKPDRMALMNSLRDRLSIDRARPYYEDTEYADIDPHYVTHKTDATRIASNAATLANAMGMNADSSQDVLLATALNNNANDAVINLQNQEQIANIKIANQYEQTNAQNLNTRFANEAQARKKYYDETQIGKQNYENAVRQSNAELLNRYIQGYTNRNMRENGKWTYADGLYGADPETGFITSIDENFYPMDPQAKSEQDATYWNMIDQFMEKGLDIKDAISMANDHYKKQEQTSFTNSGLAALARLQELI